MGYRGAYAGGGAVAAPAVVVPYMSAAPAALAAWFTANNALVNRFAVAVPTVVRYVNFQVGVQSGNIQVGIVQLAPSGSGDTIAFTRIATSGTVACPAAGVVRYDLGATTLAPGDYGLFFWADNTTVTVGHSLVTGFTGSRMSFAFSNASGVPATSVGISTTTRWLSGFTLETVL